MNRERNEVTPRSIEDGLDNSSRGMTADLNPGLRLVMDRMLRRDWFAIVRKVAQGQADSQVYDGFRLTASEVATSEEGVRVKACSDVYQGLSLIREGKQTEGNSKLVEGLSVLAKPELKEGSKGSALAELRNKQTSQTAPNNKPTPQLAADDELYFNLAATIVP